MKKTDQGRKRPTYSLDKLPKITSGSFVLNGKRGYAGSIFARPLRVGLIHFAFFRGFYRDADGKERVLMIENNDYNDVEAVDWEDFEATADWWDIVEYVEDNSQLKTIMKRARERAACKYDLVHNNCECFVNYCIHGKLESLQSAKWIKIAQQSLEVYEMFARKHPYKEIGQMMLEQAAEIRQQFPKTFLENRP